MSSVPPHLRGIVDAPCRGGARGHPCGSLAARFSLRMGYRLILAGMFALLLGLMFLGQTLSAPDWLRQRVADRLDQALPGHAISFGDLRFVMRDGWRPRLGLRDVDVTDSRGVAVLNLSNAEISLALRPLLSGTLQPRRITLSGLRATLQRRADGTIAVEYGTSRQSRREAASVPALIDSWKRQLLQPPMAGLVEIELSALTLRYDDGRSGRSWTVDDGRLVLLRRGDDLQISGSLAVLSGRATAASLDVRYDGSLLTQQARFGVTFSDVPADDIAVQAAALGWLQPLRAPISGAMRGGLDDTGASLPFNASLRIGAGVLQPSDAARAIPFRSVRSYFTFDPDTQSLSFDELTVDSDWGSGTAEGHAFLVGLADGRLTELVGQFTLGETSLNPAGLYDSPLILAGAESDFRLRLDPFEITLGRAVIRDAQTSVSLQGRAGVGPEGWDAALGGHLETIGRDKLMAVWPKSAAEKPRSWIAGNVLGGGFSDVDWALRARPGQAPDLYLDFEFSGGAVRFAPTLPPLTGADGYASLVGHRLAITAIRGAIVPDEGGPVDASGTTFIIPDIRARPATPAVVRVRGSGTPTAALSLLSRPPLSVLRGTGLPVALAEGRLNVQGALALPMRDRVTFGDMDFHAVGEALEVTSTVLVPGHVLQADRLDLVADTRGIDISGRGEISGVPASAHWHQPLGPEARQGSRVSGDVEVSPRAVAAFNLGLPPDSVTGTGQASFTLDLAPGAAPRLFLASDLRGVGLAVPALDWRKRPDRPGALALEARLGPTTDVTSLTLSGAGLTARGRLLTRADGGLDRADFQSVRLSDWLDVRAQLRGRGGTLQPEIRILGGRFDLGRARFGPPQSGDSPPLTVVNLDRLDIADGLALTGVSGDFRTTGGLSGTFAGRVNGGAPVTGRVVPQAGSSAFEIVSADAGGVFRDAGIIHQATGGDMTLKLVPAADAPGEFDGALRVDDTRVTKAPAIAALINAISLVGLVDELSGNGIVFTEVDARFRLSREALILTESSAVGPSIGLSMDGTYDLNTARMDMQGVLSPLYLLNAIGGVVTPRRGEGLIGFNFNLRGAADDPRVAVNPLSALTPGVLREIFRKPAPKVGKSASGAETAPRKPRHRGEILSGEDR
ncbi:MAG: DUF3971 domain-containing protein [Marinibacterium sp.]